MHPKSPACKRTGSLCFCIPENSAPQEIQQERFQFVQLSVEEMPGARQYVQPGFPNLLARPPKHVSRGHDVVRIALREQPGWVTFSLDGKFAYPSTGEVIDTAGSTPGTIVIRAGADTLVAVPARTTAWTSYVPGCVSPIW